MTTPIEELTTEIQGLETNLAAEKDDTKKAEIQKTLDEKKNKHKELVSDEKNKVPYHKFKKVNDELKALSERLATFEGEKKTAAEEKMKKDGEFQKLLEQKETENKQLKTQLEQLTGERKQEKVNNVLLKAISKHNPFDSEDVLALLDKGNLKVNDVAGSIVVEGVEGELEKLKKSKPHLFKAKGNDKRDGDENSKANAGTLDSVEAEFKILQAKENLTPLERAKFQKLGEQLTKLRAAARK